jgi:hypothetical protein
MTAGMLRASLIRIGLAPRPNSMARGDRRRARRPVGLARRQAGRRAGAGDDEDVLAWLHLVLEQLRRQPGERLLLLLARRLVERIGDTARQSGPKAHLDIDRPIDRVADDFVYGHESSLSLLGADLEVRAPIKTHA